MVGSFPRPSRLIPACAGKTLHGDGQTYLQWAHPRVCGENAPLHCFRLYLWGSSPRVRGKPEFKRHEFAGVRLIPACAGKTRTTKNDLP